MGIQYLTAFVSRHFKGWKKSPVKGKLIVDGNSLAYDLLYSGVQSEICGGDYITIATQMNAFFNALLKAGINPLVVLDGIARDKKVNTIVLRNNERLKCVIRFYYEGTQPIDVLPTVKKHTKPFLFFNVIVDSVKRILGDDHLFIADDDADVDVASLAIHHQCPVLSSDGDFYIFPLLYGYIPYSRLHWYNAEKNVIYGEFYSYQMFCEQFRICDPSLLTVIPAIVGNDTITRLDKNLLQTIMPENCYTDNPVEIAVRYVATVATFDICLASLRKQKLYGLIKNIQHAHDDYFFLPLFKPRSSLVTSLYCKDGSPLPEFILKLYRKGVIPSYVIDILRACEISFSVVVEDVLSESWCRLIGVPIRRIIYGILCGSDVGIVETQRCKCAASYKEVKIESITHAIYDGKQIPLPTLESCGSEDIDKEYGKKILFGVLGARVENFENIPQDYHLVLAITRFWYENCTINKKRVLLESFLILLQLLKEDKTIIGHKSTRSLVKPMQAPFRVASFVHAFAQWQTVYHDIQSLNELLQVPLKLLPVSDFLECSNLYYLVEAVMKEGNSSVIKCHHLNLNIYQAFYAVTSPD